MNWPAKGSSSSELGAAVAGPACVVVAVADVFFFLFLFFFLGTSGCDEVSPVGVAKGVWKSAAVGLGDIGNESGTLRFEGFSASFCGFAIETSVPTISAAF